MKAYGGVEVRDSFFLTRP